MDPAVYAMPEAPRPIPDGAAVSSDGITRQRWIKEAVRVGTWVMGNGKSVEVTPARLSGWVETFRGMKAAGVRVPLMSDHSFDAADTRGDVEDLYIGTSPADGKPALFAKYITVGQGATDEAARNDVSIYADNLKDGAGKEWPDAIQHIALTPIPVVPGQSGPVPIAASRGGTPIRVPVARLSRQEKKPMFDWKPLAAQLSLDSATLTDETAGAAILAKIGELAPLAQKVTDLTAQVASLSRKPEYDSDTLDMAADAVLSRIGTIATAGKINAAQKTELEAMLCGTATARPAACLSRKASAAAGLGDQPLSKRILDIFEKGSEPKARGTATGAQLSREGGDVVTQKEIDARAARAAGRPVPA